METKAAEQFEGQSLTGSHTATMTFNIDSDVSPSLTGKEVSGDLGKVWRNGRGRNERRENGVRRHGLFFPGA